MSRQEIRLFTVSFDNASEETIAAVKTALTSNKTLTLAPEKKVVIKPGVSSGMMAGGSLTTLCHLLARSYMPDFKDKILLIEDTGCNLNLN